MKAETLLVTFVICLAVQAVSAREIVRFDEETHHAHYMTAIQRAAGVLPINPKDGDQVRVCVQEEDDD